MSSAVYCPECGNCADVCIIATDLFDGTLSHFDETGTPTIVSGSLELDSGDGVVFDSAAASVDDAVRIYGTVDTSDDPATLRFELAWSDASNSLWGEVSVSGSVWTVKAGRRVGGSDSDYTDAKEVDAPTLPAVFCVSWHPGETQEADSFNTEYQYPAVSSDLGLEWVDPDNIFAEDGMMAVRFFGTDEISGALSSGQHGFAIPPGSIIDGIEVRILARSDMDIADTGRFPTVRLIGPFGASSNKGPILISSTGLDVHGAGASNDTWGITPTWEDINDPTFGLEVTAEYFGGATGGSISIDAMAIKVYFTTPERRPGRLRVSIDGQCVTEFSAENPDEGLKAGARSTAGTWEIADLHYEYATSDSRPSCTNCTCDVVEGECGFCTDVAPLETYLVDVDLNFASGVCDGCEALGGEYLVEPTGIECWWQHYETLPNCEAASNPIFSVSLTNDEFSGWVVVVQIGDAFATYSLGSAVTDCQDLPQTLTLVSVGGGGDECTGDFPETVTLDEP